MKDIDALFDSINEYKYGPPGMLMSDKLYKEIMRLYFTVAEETQIDNTPAYKKRKLGI